MTANATDLLEGCQFVLEQVGGAAIGLGVALPARQYCTVGGSVYDCEQVVVSAMTSANGVVGAPIAPTAGLGPCEPVWNVTYEVGIVRCAHEAVQGRRGDVVPTTGQIEDDTAAMSADYAVLLNAIEALSSSRVGAVTASIQFGQPQGGLIAVVATITANLWM